MFSSASTRRRSAIPTIDGAFPRASQVMAAAIEASRRRPGGDWTRAGLLASRWCVQGVHTAEILLLAATAPAARELVLRAVLNIMKLSEVMRPLPQQCGDGLGMGWSGEGDVVVMSNKRVRSDRELFSRSGMHGPLPVSWRN